MNVCERLQNAICAGLTAIGEQRQAPRTSTLFTRLQCVFAQVVLLAAAADVLQCHVKVYAGLSQLLVRAMQLCETVMIHASEEKRASTCDS
jgi:hypothetical protein